MSSVFVHSLQPGIAIYRKSYWQATSILSDSEYSEQPGSNISKISDSSNHSVLVKRVNSGPCMILALKYFLVRAANYSANAHAFLGNYLVQTIPHTTKGLAYPSHLGAARAASHVAFLCFVHSKNLAKYKVGACFVL